MHNRVWPWALGGLRDGLRSGLYIYLLAGRLVNCGIGYCNCITCVRYWLRMWNCCTAELGSLIAVLGLLPGLALIGELCLNADELGVQCTALV